MEDDVQGDSDMTVSKSTTPLKDVEVRLGSPLNSTCSFRIGELYEMDEDELCSLREDVLHEEVVNGETSAVILSLVESCIANVRHDRRFEDEDGSSR